MTGKNGVKYKIEGSRKVQWIKNERYEEDNIKIEGAPDIMVTNEWSR